jgi:hypothetical protein
MRFLLYSHVFLGCRPSYDGRCTGKGGNPDIIRDSQKRRYADSGLVDKVIGLDNAWRDGMPPHLNVMPGVEVYCWPTYREF